MYDTIIIGAGMSGLAAGIRLAHFNHRVCILERHTQTGGLNSFYRLGGRDYDVGLHAVTNYSPKGAKRGPLARLLRQLRLSWDELELVPQTGSTIVFPGISLSFSNDFGLLESEIDRVFPRQKDNLRRLVARIADYDDAWQPGMAASAREVANGLIDDPLLVEVLFCPLLFYGSPRENDMDFGLFSILFRSIYLEGLSRPWIGVRSILRTLVRKFKDLGGELRLRSGVSRIVAKDGSVKKLILDDGTELSARHVLSSAGGPETMRLCENGGPAQQQPAGQLSFVETISVLGTQPRDLGLDRTMVFFNDSERFHYEKPEDPVDLRSGVVCSPNNFLYETPLEEGVIRVTALANYDRWAAMEEASYRQAKLRWYDRIAASAVRFVPDFRQSVIAADTFTPATIRRFTGRENGAVYGSPEKRPDGTTHLKNLYLCGTDQGLVGIIGAMISGITIVNKHLLK